MALNITKEDILKKLDGSPAQKFLDAPEVTKKISEISENHYFDIDPAENLVFHQLVTLAAIGVLDKNGLIEEIIERIETDEQNASGAADGVFRLLSGIPTEPATTITPVVMAGLPPKAAQTEPPAAPTAPTSSPAAQIPVFGPGRGTQNNPQTVTPNTPFVIHSNEEVRSNVNMDAEARGTVRPVFYKPVSVPRQSADYARPAAVKVDIGGANEVNPQAVPKTVNYTVRTPQAQPKTTPNVPPPQVDPENIVDLKVSLNDLPK